MPLGLADAAFARVAFGFAADESAFQPHSWLRVLICIALPHFGHGRFGNVIFAAIDFSGGMKHHTLSYDGTIISALSVLATNKDSLGSLPMFGKSWVPSTKVRREGRSMSTGHEDLSVAKLVELLQYPDPVVRVHAGFVLGTLEDEALPAVPVLIEMLRFGVVQDRKLAATTLGQIGPAASEAVPTLLEAANKDEDEDVSDMAMWALERIDLADTESDAEAA